MSKANVGVSLVSVAAAFPALIPVAVVLGLVGGVVWLLSDDEATSDAPGAAKPATGTGIRRGRFARSIPAKAAIPAPQAIAPTALPTPATPPARTRCRSTVTTDDVRAVLACGTRSRKEAVAALCERTGCGHTAAYKTFAAGSRYSDLISEGEDGRLMLQA